MVASSGLVALEIGFHRGLVELDAGFDHLDARGFALGLEVGRDLFVVVLGAERLVFPHDGLHADEVHEGP